MFQKIKGFFKRPLILNILITGVAILFVKVLGFYKETFVAFAFRISELIDTLYITILITIFVQNVFISSLKNIFIPNYISDLKANGGKGAFLSVIFIIIFLICCFFFLFIVGFKDDALPLLFPNHTNELYSLIHQQLYCLLLCLFFWEFSSLISGLLDVSNQFFASTFWSLFVLLAMIVCLLWFKTYFGQMVLTIGILIGSSVSFLYFLGIVLRNNIFFSNKLKINTNAVEILRQLPQKISSRFLRGINNFFDQLFCGTTRYWIYYIYKLLSKNSCIYNRHSYFDNEQSIKIIKT